MFHPKNVQRMLFNKNNNGQAELKSLLGFLYASNSFQNLVTDIELSEDIIRDIFGDAFLTAVQAHYDSDDFMNPGEDPGKKAMDKLVHYVQLPIAFHAYKSYSANADVTHSDKGRQVSVTETEKPAFEWQIERDDQALLQKAHRFTDRLIQFCDNNKTIPCIAAYFETEQYKASRDNLIGSTAVFDRIYPIDNSRRFYLKLCPFIQEATRTFILPVVGQQSYEDMLGEVRQGNGTQAVKQLLELSRIPLALFTMGFALHRLGIDILPDGVYQNIISDRISMKGKLPAPMEFKREASVLLMEQANDALQRLQNHIAKLATEADGLTYEYQLPSDRRTSEDKHFRV